MFLLLGVTNCFKKSYYGHLRENKSQAPFTHTLHPKKQICKK